MSERTPPEGTVRAAFARAHPFPASTSVEERYAEFDRFIARVRARAIREARKAFYEKHPRPPMLGGNQEPGEGVGAKYAIDVAMDFLARFADEQENE